jgi:pyruvate-formate lyase-activating enzyme
MSLFQRPARILLVNPPIYDFSAYDFWLKPYGMLRVAGFLRGQAEFQLFDFMDRLDSRVPQGNYRADESGRGEFYSELTEKPAVFSHLRRRFKRFGLPRQTFESFLSCEQRFDYALVQTGMTYWYLGVREVIDVIRAVSPQTKIILGGVYATLCAAHAQQLGADLVVEGLDLNPLWRFLSMTLHGDQLPLWDLYPRLQTGVLKLADGCPFRCSYCSVPQVYPKFHARPLERSLAELEFLIRLGAKDVAFYDDALLFQPEQIFKPFLKQLLSKGIEANLHTPNALNARFINRELANLMIRAGFKNIYLGFESSAYAWQKKTGGKVYSEELERAVDNLIAAGAEPRRLHAYIIVGHPAIYEQNVEESIRFANRLGIRVMLSEFSPIPGTPDGEACRPWVNLDEPLCHNKTAYTIAWLGAGESNRLKSVATQLNRSLNSLEKIYKPNIEETNHSPSSP